MPPISEKVPRKKREKTKSKKFSQKQKVQNGAMSPKAVHRQSERGKKPRTENQKKNAKAVHGGGELCVVEV